MTVIFILIQLGIMFFLNNLGIDPDINAYILIFFNIFYITAMIITKYKDIYIYLITGYFLRIILMFWDIYAKHIFVFPNSGADTEGFYKTSIQISENLYLLRENMYGGLYTKILGIIFSLVGENRIIAQYINVLLGIGIIILIYKILKLLNVRDYYINLATLMTIFFPNALIFSAILLRENFISFFVTLSFLYFIKWYKFGLIKNQLISIIFILLASIFHSGVIGILLGYLFMYIMYDRSNNKFKFSLKSIIVMVISIIIIIVILSYGDVILNKFSKVETVDDLVSTSNKRSGESQYLASLQSDSWWQMLLTSPVYMLYFLISPVPLDWRGISDVVTFFVDSSFYLYFIYIIYKMRKIINKENPIILGLITILMITVVPFGIGVQNAGTAMRHRHKIFPLFIILIALIKNEVVVEKSEGKHANEI